MSDNAKEQTNETPLDIQPEQTTNVNLWPDSITRPRIRAPITILKEQASLLGQRTQNIVIAEVNPVPRNYEQLVYAFSLVAPALGNYRVLLFSVVHSMITVYPLTIIRDYLAPPPQQTIPDEREFLKVLKALFNDRRTIQAIESMLTLSDPVGSSVRPTEPRAEPNRTS